MTTRDFAMLLASAGCPSDSQGRGKCPACAGECFLVAGGIGTCSTCRQHEIVSALRVSAAKAGLDALDVEAHVFEPARFLDARKERVSSETKLPWRTGTEILAATPVDVRWVAWPLAASGMLTELTGKAKLAGKTTLLMHLIGAVLEGRPFLARPTLRGPVVLLTEERPSTLVLALRRANVMADELYVVSRTDCSGVTWPDVVADAIRACKATGAVLLIVDTISPFAGLSGDQENNAGDALAALAPLQAAAALGIAVLVVRHERKGGGEVGEAGRGSTAFTGAVDITASLQRFQGANDRRRQLRLPGRADLPDSIAIELTEDRYVVHGDGQFNAAEEAASALLAILTPNLSATEAELSGRLPRISRTTLRGSLERLCEKGEAVRSGAGKKGDPFRFSGCDQTTIPGIGSPSETNHVGRGQPGVRDGGIVWP